THGGAGLAGPVTSMNACPWEATHGGAGLAGPVTVYNPSVSLDDRSTAPHEALWPDHRDPGRVVQLRAGRDRGLPGPERGGEGDDDAHPRLLHARLERDGAGRGARRVPRVAGGPQANRLPPGERAALRGPPRRAVPGFRRRGQGRGAQRASTPGRGG